MVLTLAFVWNGAENVEHFASTGLRNHWIAVEFRQLALEPVGVNIKRMQLLFLLAAKIDTRGSGSIGVDCVITLLFISILVAVFFISYFSVHTVILVLFIRVLKLDIDSILVVNLFFTSRCPLILAPVSNLFAKVDKQSKSFFWKTTCKQNCRLRLDKHHNTKQIK